MKPEEIKVVPKVEETKVIPTIAEVVKELPKIVLPESAVKEVPKVPEVVPKTLENSDISGAKVNVPDIKIIGNGDSFQLLCKAYSKTEGWMKSCKAYQINGLGCIVQVTTQQGDNVAEALCFVPGTSVIDDVNGGRKLVWSETTKRS